jgi:hypothetical protein
MGSLGEFPPYVHRSCRYISTAADRNPMSNLDHMRRSFTPNARRWGMKPIKHPFGRSMYKEADHEGEVVMFRDEREAGYLLPELCKIKVK